MLDGLDEALTGMTAGESKTFTAELAGGERAGLAADVQVTVNSVKVKELPELDDEFAQSASEFDTVGELRASTRKQLDGDAPGWPGGPGQGAAARCADRPARHPAAGADHRGRGRAAAAPACRTSWTGPASPCRPTWTPATRRRPRSRRTSRRTPGGRSRPGSSWTSSASQEDLKVSAEQLSAYVTEQAYRMGVAPDRLAQQLSDNGQLPAVAADVLRGNALTWLAERATGGRRGGPARCTSARPRDAEARRR